MATTKIEWATRVWNPVTGCTNTCKFPCYARSFANRMKSHPNKAIAHKYRLGFKPTVHYELFFEPRKWRKPERVFVCSMGELFDPTLTSDAFLKLADIMSEFNGKHTFMLLTRRPMVMLEWVTQFCEKHKIDQLPDNIWCGVSVSNQQEANLLIPILLNVQAAVKFASIEPLTELITLTQTGQDFYHNFLTGEFADKNGKHTTPKLDWVIVGGMTGAGATPMHPGWARCLRDFCKHHNTPFFFKGWGEYGNSKKLQLPISRYKLVDFKSGKYYNSIEEMPPSEQPYYNSLYLEFMPRSGKKLSGRLLDGREHNDFPE